MAKSGGQFEQGFSDTLKNRFESVLNNIREFSSSVDAKIRKKLLQAGPAFSPEKFIKFVVIPLLLIGFTLSFSIQFILFRMLPFLNSGWFQYLPIIIPLLCITIIIFYPRTIVDARRNDMNSKMHLYITYLGVLSTSKPTRRMLFHMASEKEDYGELAKESKNVFRLGDNWRLGYIKACRIISETVPSQTFADFLARIAHSFQSGEDSESFLTQEQKVVMNSFDAEYRGALYRVEGMKEMYTSLSTTLAFITCFGMLVPFITGQSLTGILYGIIMAFVFIDTMTFYLILTVLPKDDVIHELRIEKIGRASCRERV